MDVVNKGDRFICKIGKVVNGITYFNIGKVYQSDTYRYITGELRKQFLFEGEEIDRFFERVPKMGMDEVKNEKQNLITDITCLINKFEKNTGASVSEFKYSRPLYSKGMDIGIKVEI